MISPKELREAGVSEDDIIAGVMGQAGLDRERAIRWIAAIDRDEAPWKDLVQEDPERGGKTAGIH